MTITDNTQKEVSKWTRSYPAKCVIVILASMVPSDSPHMPSDLSYLEEVGSRSLAHNACAANIHSTFSIQYSIHIHIDEDFEQFS